MGLPRLFEHARRTTTPRRELTGAALWRRRAQARSRTRAQARRIVGRRAQAQTRPATHRTPVRRHARPATTLTCHLQARRRTPRAGMSSQAPHSGAGTVASLGAALRCQVPPGTALGRRRANAQPHAKAAGHPRGQSRLTGQLMQRRPWHHISCAGYMDVGRGHRALKLGRLVVLRRLPRRAHAARRRAGQYLLVCLVLAVRLEQQHHLGVASGKISVSGPPRGSTPASKSELCALNAPHHPVG